MLPSCDRPRDPRPSHREHTTGSRSVHVSLSADMKTGWRGAALGIPWPASFRAVVPALAPQRSARRKAQGRSLSAWHFSFWLLPGHGIVPVAASIRDTLTDCLHGRRYRPDVLIHAEQVRGIVLVLDRSQPIVVVTERRLDPLLALIHHEIDVRAAGRVRMHRVEVVLAPFGDLSLWPGRDPRRRSLPPSSRRDS